MLQTTTTWYKQKTTTMMMVKWCATESKWMALYKNGTISIEKKNLRQISVKKERLIPHVISLHHNIIVLFFIAHSYNNKTPFINLKRHWQQKRSNKREKRVYILLAFNHIARHTAFIAQTFFFLQSRSLNLWFSPRECSHSLSFKAKNFGAQNLVPSFSFFTKTRPLILDL